MRKVNKISKTGSRAKGDSIAKVEPDRKMMALGKRIVLGSKKAVFGIHKEMDGSPEVSRFLYGSYTGSKLELEQANLGGARVTFLPQITDGKGAKAKNVIKINSVFIDIDNDFERSLKKLSNSKFPPDVVVSTSKNRGLVMWLVKNCPLEDFPRVQKALAKFVGGDLSRTSPASTVRLAGSLHHKKGTHLVKLLVANIKASHKDVWKLCKGLGVKVPEQPSDSNVVAKPDDSKVPIEDIRRALGVIPPAEIKGREMWLKLMMAVHSAVPNDEGYKAYQDFCKGEPGYVEKDQQKAWKSLKSNGRVTVATLFDLASKYSPSQVKADVMPAFVDSFAVLDRFAEEAKDTLRYDAGRKAWLVWQESVWTVDPALVEQRARHIAQKIATDLYATGEQFNRKQASSLRSMAAVRALLGSATTHPLLSATSEMFDANPYLLAVKNGVIDLRTGEFRPSTPQDMLVVQANVVFDHQATAPKFKKFMNFFTCGRPKLEEYLQRVLGYMLLGHGKEQVAFILLGDTENGKGVLSRVMEFVLGKYVISIAPNLLTKAYSGNPNSPTPALMALRGARMYLCGEGQEGKPFDAAFFKQLSGNDTFTARDGYASQGEFRPVGKLWLSTNELPDVDRQQKAIWRRMVIIPCDGKVEKVNRNLDDELAQEASGVLNWLIEGTKAYRKNGLGSCEEVDQAKKTAMAKSDSVANWIAEKCSTGSKKKVQASVAYKDYIQFIRSTGRVALSIQRFHKAMVKKGHPTKRRNGYNTFLGIDLKLEK
ncbi:phage/plasmid primase, P4 family [Rhodoferax sp. TH121]|uniref:phage/plasmid primase, P4 family n=1 Tax=Rhodoferax sp. TH121 TaxID=2022803 RepID=UPI00113FF74A|nr:phage/plasmid primase, P4 family [Rhodoferax sp. TH121]